MRSWVCRLAAAVADPEGRFVPEALRARRLCREKRYGEALDVLWQMLNRARRSGSPVREAFVLIHFGHVYRHEHAETALKFLQDGLHVARSCGFGAGEMLAYDALGELCYRQGDIEQALDFYQQSLASARQLRDRVCERDILLEMVNCYEARGDFSRCDELLDRALRLDCDCGILVPGDYAKSAEADALAQGDGL